MLPSQQHLSIITEHLCNPTSERKRTKHPNKKGKRMFFLYSLLSQLVFLFPSPIKKDGKEMLSL